MSANTVQILSDPKIIVALEQFQGIRKEQDEVQLLSKPKIIVALKGSTPQWRGGISIQKKRVEVVEEEDLFDEAVLHNIKQEDKRLHGRQNVN